jgi:hypothetical protein
MKIRLLTLIKICVDTTEWVAQKAFDFTFPKFDGVEQNNT